MTLLGDFDHQAAQQLVEVVFHRLFFGVSYFDATSQATLFRKQH